MKNFQLSFLIITANLALWIPNTHAQTTVINVTEDTIDGVLPSDSGYVTPVGETVVGGFIGDVFFRRTLDSDDFGSGSGTFRDLYRLQDNSSSTNPQDGYNRAEFSDVGIPGGYDPYLTVGEMTLSSEGTSYVFAFDTHESTGGTQEYISLDDFRIYVGGPTDPETLPTTTDGLSDLGTLVYDMNAKEDSYVLMDSSLYAGSGQMDLFAFVPTANFDGFDPDSYVYVYTSWGQYSYSASGLTAGFNTTSTPEQVASGAYPYPSYAIVPEPSTSLFLFAFGSIFCLFFRPTRSNREPS